MAGSSWADYLKKTNRYFLPNAKSRIIDTIIREIDKHPTEDLTGKIFWRARKHTNGQENAYSPKEMGAPPANSTRGGRVNPDGIPCLYLADSIETAIAETRPWKGACVSVACFKLRKKHKLADIRDDKIFSDFLNELHEADEPLQMPKEVILYSAFMVSSFSRPAQEENAVDYVPTQYFSAQLKHIGYKGILYDSMMHDIGFNLAIFNPRGAVDLVGKIDVYEVTAVSYTTELQKRDMYEKKKIIRLLG